MLAPTVFALLPFVLFGCSTLRKPIAAKSTPTIGPFYSKGVASWYGGEFHGRRTASGERYDQYGFTAAHRTLPFGTRLTVTNLANGLSTVVKVNDRGPFAKDRILDLSYGAAKAIGLVGPGTGVVQLELVDGPGPPPRYTVQVGAFSAPERANELHDRLQGTFPEVYVQTDGTWYRVQVGAFGERDQAEGMRRELAALGMSAFVIAAQ
jgi:rare lipoprotein A